MQAHHLFKEGRLADAIEAQIADVRSHPTDQNKRFFLFELLLFSGDLERAEKHLSILNYDDPKVEIALGQYKLLLELEKHRRQVCTGHATPEFLGEAPEHILLRLKALKCLTQDNPTEAATLVNQALELAPTLKATVNGKAVDVFRDWDDLFSHVLEVSAKGKYYWVALEQVKHLRTNPPKAPRDLYWLPAHLVTQDQFTAQVFVSGLYPFSHLQENEQIQLGRVTEFTETEPVRGYGTRVFIAGEEDVPIVHLREVDLVVGG